MDISDRARALGNEPLRSNDPVGEGQLKGTLIALADAFDETHDDYLRRHKDACGRWEALLAIKLALFTDDPAEIAPLNAGAVGDTLWVSEGETLRDFLERCLSRPTLEED